MSKKLKILKVIHGFPPDYMAGSEVYSYNLCKELHKQGHDIYVFTRVENEFDEPYTIYKEEYESLHITRVNKPKDYIYDNKFYDEDIDNIFKRLLEEINPDIIHFGHVCHLSVNLVEIAKSYGKKIVFTLHDFWLYCVKGQLINEKNEICNGPDIDKCLKCSPYKPTRENVKNNILYMEKIRDNVDIFISPSHTVRDFFISHGTDKNKILYNLYGFNKELIQYKKRVYKKDTKINFAFMGRIIPTKGIKLLLKAFKELPNINLKIYGSIGNSKRFLESDNISFMGGYNNNNINSILSEIDVLIVPSVWLENSPLVIQEAFLSGVTVITSNIGGMKELINEDEGFLFDPTNYQSLISIITKINNNPEILNNIKNNRNKVLSIEDDAKYITKVYYKLLNIPKIRRITIDTNPDKCNYKCIMCDTHSIYNKKDKNKRPDMDKELLLKCFEEIKTLNIDELIPTTMGEPTLYKYFNDIVDFCFNNNIKLNLTTNGSMLFSKQYNEEYIVNKLLNIISDVKISFNSLSSDINEKIMINSNTNNILNTIEKLCMLRDKHSSNISITIQMTFMKSNIDSIVPIIEKAIDLGINRIKGHQLWITHNELEKEAIYKDEESIKKWNNLIDNIEQYKKYIKLENFTKINNINKYNSGDCPFLLNELWINYKGDISVCCAPDTERSKLGDFGNIANTNIKNIINSEKYINLCKNYKAMEICQKCLMRK